MTGKSPRRLDRALLMADRKRTVQPVQPVQPTPTAPTTTEDGRAAVPSRLERALLMADKKLMVQPTTIVPTTSGDGKAVHRLMPQGFEPCPRSHACPSCRSSLILKVPASGRPLKSKKSVETGDQDNVSSSLETANAANMLLQALSFDAATRSEKQELDVEQLAEGVSYCPECKVHVITSAEELERLFDKYDGENEEGVGDMEWLRGSLLVTVDDAEVMALSKPKCRVRQRQRQQERPIPSLMPTQSELSTPYQQQSLLTAQSDSLSAHISDMPDAAHTAHVTRAATQRKDDAGRQPRHLQPKPTRPIEFDYDYRHRVATNAMAGRISRGASLLEEICPECEMPLMKEKRGKACVVCPKLLRKIEKYYPDGVPESRCDEIGLNEDPISAIIKQAHAEAPRHSSGRRKKLEPEIAEAKQYIMQRRILGGGSRATKPNHPQKGRGIGSDGSEAGSTGTESLTDQTSSTTNDPPKLGTPTRRGATTPEDNVIDWEALLVNGRAVLSKRLNEGWVLSSANCAGPNCKGTPLLQRCPDIEERAAKEDALQYCVVCGGLGSGLDGAYERELELLAEAAKLAEVAAPNWEDLRGNGRALLAERLKQGWTMSSENCAGCHCNEMPLTNFEGGPNNCVVCAGTGTGVDGRYEDCKMAEDEGVEEERDMVSHEISRLLSMGWVLRESLCAQCLMPLVAEDPEAKDELCILCGQLPENNPHMQVDGADGNFDSYVECVDEGLGDGVDNGDSYMSNGVANNDSYGDDSYMNGAYADEANNEAPFKCNSDEDPDINRAPLNDNANGNLNINEVLDQLATVDLPTGHHGNDPALIAKIKESLTIDDDIDNNQEEEEREEEQPNMEQEEEDQDQTFNETLYEAVNAPVATFGNDNTDQAGKKLVMGWTLPDAGPCHHCQGVLMSPPNSHEIGCINRGCPSALAAAYTFLPEPYESTGPVRLIGRGFTLPAKGSYEEKEEEEEERNVYEVGEEQHPYWEYKEQNEDYYYDVNGTAPDEQYEEQYMEPTHDDGPPMNVYGKNTNHNNYQDETSILSDDMTEDRSVASSTLGVILVRLDDAKYELERMIEGGNGPQECAQKQVEIAMLIEKLANAAVAMKRRE